MGCFLDSEESKEQPTHLIWQTLTKMAYIPKGNSAWLLRKAINRSDSAIADLETNLTTLARTASNTGTSTTTQVLFNDAGIVNGDAGLVYNKTTDALTVGGALGVTGAATVQGLTVGKGTGAYASNTAFGTGCLAAVTSNSNSTAIGSTSLQALNSGISNTAIGSRSLESCQIGDRNTAVGYLSSVGNVAGTDVVSVGYASMLSSAGSANTAVGSNAGGNHLVGSNNAFFGFNAQPSATTISDEYTYGNITVANHRFVNGNVVLGVGNVVMSTSAKGIDFSATSGTGTSELLNDYEEGTWTPTDSSGAGLVFTVSDCKYTKIGRAVTIQGTITYPATANTNAAQFTGLPFAFVGIAPFSIAYTGIAAATVNYLIAHSSTGPLFYSSTGSQTQNAALSGGLIQFFGTYMI